MRSNKALGLIVILLSALGSISAHAESIFDNLRDREMGKVLVCSRDKIGMCLVDDTIKKSVPETVKAVSFQEYIDLQVGKGYRITDVEYEGTSALLYFKVL